ncbi:MAG: sulfatase-like hydrolase/transferase [Clostridia bacterium]|nr:sulfatase-like hydrolase/transferase [Clostridia bacterium]
MNIVFIMSDDQGYWSLGCEGNHDAITPNIDAMAAKGVSLSRFFCTSPVCSPARASILTGRMPSDHGVLDWIRKGNVDSENDKPIEYLKGKKAYTDYLHENGYKCGISGKWHLGYSEKPQNGFEYWYVHQCGSGSYYNAPMIRDGKPILEKGYITDNITDAAISFIEKNADCESPFYLNVSYTAPHTPWIANHPPEYLKLFDGCSFDSCPILPRHQWQISFAPFENDREENLKGYFASIMAMDAGIGRIMSCLSKNRLTESTLVIFTSDNGFNCGHHGIWGKGNGTFPFNMYDTSVRVPFILSMPGTLPEGRKIDDLISAYDWFPTVLELAGIENQETDLPGESFAGLLAGNKQKQCEKDVYVYDEYGDTRMIRTSEWKYVCRYPAGPDELYNMVEDPEENNNCIETADSTIIQMLRNKMKNWFKRYSCLEANGLAAGVTGCGQDKMHGVDGYETGSFFVNK